MTNHKETILTRRFLAFAIPKWVQFDMNSHLILWSINEGMINFQLIAV